MSAKMESLQFSCSTTLLCNNEKKKRQATHFHSIQNDRILSWQQISIGFDFQDGNYAIPIIFYEAEYKKTRKKSNQNKTCWSNDSR